MFDFFYAIKLSLIEFMKEKKSSGDGKGTMNNEGNLI